jgi:hypothetical protein
LVNRAINYVEENFLAPQKDELAAKKKRKVVPFRAA